MIPSRPSDAGPLGSRHPQCELRRECEAPAVEECAWPKCNRIVCSDHSLRCHSCGQGYCLSCVARMGDPLWFVCDSCTERAEKLKEVA